MKNFSIPLAIAVSVAVVLGACDDSGPPRGPTRPDTPSVPVPQFATLTGVVTEPVAVPVADATVTVADGPFKGQSSATGVDGKYVLSVPAGVVTIEARKDGYASVTKQVAVPETRIVDFEITPLVPRKIDGNWLVTIEASPQCPAFPADARVRRYGATITQEGTDIELELTGAKFAAPARFPGTIEGGKVTIGLGSSSGCFYCYYPDVGLVEEIAKNRFVGIGGTIVATASQSTIAGVLTGWLTVMKSAEEPFIFDASCSGNHRVTFDKR